MQVLFQWNDLNWFQKYTELRYFVLRLVHGAVREDVKVCQLRKEQREKSTVRYYTADHVYKRKSAYVLITVKYISK